MDKELLSLLACPETKKSLVEAEENVVALVNKAIEESRLRTKLQEPVRQEISGGLFREDDREFLYPVRDGIPVLLVEELIDVRGIIS